jgi:hypothetical protein
MTQPGSCLQTQNVVCAYITPRVTADLKKMTGRLLTEAPLDVYFATWNLGQLHFRLVLCLQVFKKET